MGGRPIRTKLIQYAQQRPGMLLVVSDVAADINETPERVGSGFSHILHKEISGFERVATGVYTYRPNAKPVQVANPPEQPPKPAQKVYEWVGDMKDGNSIVRCDEGRLYRLEAL